MFGQRFLEPNRRSALLPALLAALLLLPFSAGLLRAQADADPDQDGVLTPQDNCPTVHNPNQEDSDFRLDCPIPIPTQCQLTPEPDMRIFVNRMLATACDDAMVFAYGSFSVKTCTHTGGPYPNGLAYYVEWSDTSGGTQTTPEHYLVLAEQDWAGDGIDNQDDNCLVTANAGQEAADGDGRGDACDNCNPLPDTSFCPAVMAERGCNCSFMKFDPICAVCCNITRNALQTDGDGEGIGTCFQTVGELQVT